MVPLVLVYWAEYAIQAGAWTAFALPPSDLHDGAARQRAYELLNLCYQVGVFFSRSSGNLIVLRRPALWAIAWLQVANPNPNPNPNPSPNPSPSPNPNPSPSPDQVDHADRSFDCIAPGHRHALVPGAG